MSPFLTFLVAATLLAFTPGPGIAYVVARTASGGRAEGLACLDLTGLLRDSVRTGGMPHAPTDSHWSPEGHRLIARALEEMLTSLGWLGR